jgi:hypothetical protein
MGCSAIEDKDINLLILQLGNKAVACKSKAVAYVYESHERRGFSE